MVGLSKGFNGTGDNLWVITSYKKTTGKIPDEILSGDTLNLSAYKGEFNPPLTSGDEPLNNKIIPKTANESQATAEIQKRSVQDYVDEFEQTFSSKIDEMNSHSFYNGGANVVKRFKENVETIKEMNLPPLAEQTAINKLFKLYTKQMNSWYPSSMSVGGANYNVKKGEKSFEIWGKTSAEISDLMESFKRHKQKNRAK